MQRTLLIGRFLLAALLSMPALAVAQDDDPRILRARELFDEGEQHHEDGRFLLAAEAFQQAYDLMSEADHPNAGMLQFNLGASYEEVPGRERDALQAYQRFLQEAPSGEATVQELLRRVQARIQELERRIDDGSEPAPDEGGGGISPIGPIVMGVGGAALVSGIIMGAVALVQNGDQVARCPSLMNCPEDLRADVNQTQTIAAVGDALWIGGALIAAGGLVLTLVLQEDEDSSTSAALIGTPGGGVIGLEGSF